MFPALKEFLVEFFARVLRKRKEEPLPVITSKPVKVVSIWGWSAGNRRKSVFSSIAGHLLVLLFLFMVFRPTIVTKTARGLVTLISPEIPPYEVKASLKKEGGGGGGGDRSPLPPSKGRAPRPASRQFTPPSATPPEKARLIMEPTLVIQPDVKLPNVNMPNYGLPSGRIGPPSSGPGSGGGIGTGSGGGVGPGKGPGFGPGEGGGIGGGVFRVGGGVSPPIPLYKIEPEYSEMARKAKFQGTVVLSIVVDVDGLAKNIKVVRPLGLGLDEKAIEAIQKWRFRPGMKDGKPVATFATVEVNFRLL